MNLRLLQVTLVGNVLVMAGCARGPALEHVGRSFAPDDAAVAAERDADLETAPATEEAPPPPPPDDVVAQAALPFRGLRSSDGALLGGAALMSELARADAVCIGERHDNAHDHYAQLATLDALTARRDVAGFELGLGLEMFQQDTQPVLDAYASRRIELDRLERDAKWAERWGFPVQYYGLQLESAREGGVPLLALNARTELTRAVAQNGLEGLDPALAAELPEVELANATHRALFDRMIEGHPGPKEDEGFSDRMYAAQVVWDETMATRATAWLGARAPARKLVIFAGRAHCARSAIPERIERRGPFRVVSVLPEVVSGAPPELEEAQTRLEPAAVATAPDDGLARELAASYDYRFLMYKQ